MTQSFLNHRPVHSPDVPLNGWYQTNVSIPLPRAGKRFCNEDHAPILTIDGLWYRKPLEVIKEAFLDPLSAEYHLKAHKVFWNRPGDHSTQCVYGEVYTSDRMLEMEGEMRRNPPLDNVETVVVPVKLYSDSTVLSTIGNITVWPIYLALGNLSKYIGLRPSSFSDNHIAYIPSLPQSIKREYRRLLGKSPTPQVLSHLKHELMQAIWFMILNDEELIEAFKTGIIVPFFDGVQRRIMIRWFTYSADYVEKVLLICMCFLSEYLCPRCFVKKYQVIQLGRMRDMQRRINRQRVDDAARRDHVERARVLIFKRGRAVTSDAVKNLLGEGSWTPTRNSFSMLFAEHGFDYLKMFPNDLLHEIEIGTWKAIFLHLLRLLDTMKSDLLDELDERYIQIPPFGRETIRRINRNVSELKRTTAREFEDYLQVRS
ncbi:hypothetical protein K435DRAFT_820896 [Dendrothele bispora CBS 962.96]|uniref:Uncharacterized protein n=1 Tax=Dendrothele bispora (strain CBS 962.96) TaxID=1314807 RepID=A0A4S8LPA6_DENBC|nr:hypothetical protein K435DRAFT_820896 [Dendrothele bispora CBS 962.96]